MKKIILIVSAVVIVLAAIALVLVFCLKPDEPDEPDVPQPQISLSHTELTLAEDDRATLVAEVTNSTENVRWTSDRPDIVAVSNGVVLAKTEGAATVTASVGGVQATCRVTVTAAPATPDYYVMFDDGARTAVVGESRAVHAKLYQLISGSGVEQQTSVTYSSSDEEVLTVDPATGVITAKQAGTALVTATAGDASQAVAVEVYDEYITDTDGWLGMFAKRGKRFLLACDLDFAGIPYKGIEGFCDLAYTDDDDAIFTNDVNGGNHTVRNIRLENTDISRVSSIFGYVRDARIENIRFENVVFTGTHAAAGLAQRMLGGENLVRNVELDLHFEQLVEDACSGVARYMYGGSFQNILVKIDSPAIPDGGTQNIDGVCSTAFAFSGEAQLSNIVVYTSHEEIVPCRIAIADGKTYAKLPAILNNSVLTLTGKMDVAQFVWSRFDREAWTFSVNDLPTLKTP